MKKKFSLFLMMVAVVSMISMFVSCSDYDDSINSLKTQSASDITTVSGQIASLQAQLANLESAYQAADENLEVAISNALASAKSYTDDGLTDAQVAAARDYADVQAAEAELAAIAAAQNLVDAAVAALEEELALLEQNVTDAQTAASALGKAEEALILTQSAQSSAAQALDLDESDDSDDLESAVEGLQTAVASIEGTVTSIQAEISNLQGDVTSLQGDVKDLFDQATQNYADIIEVETILSVLDSANTAEHEALDVKISGVDTQLGELQKLVEDNSIKIEKALSDSVSGLRDEIAAALADAEKYADGLSDTLWTVVDKHTTLIDNIQVQISDINEHLGILGKRLTSLVFAPTTYVDGIEAITFSTLSYTAWEDLTGDEPDGADYIINNDMNIEEYLVSPSHLNINSIESLSYVCTYATNYSTTRAVTDKAPIEVASYVYDKNDDGVKTLQLKLQKTNPDDDFSEVSDNNFPIVALKATIAKEYLLEDEVEAGEEVAVYSDWARLYEIHATPYIHNTQSVDENGTPIEEATGNESASHPFKGHFFNYTTITTHTDTSVGVSQTKPMSYHHTAYWIVDEFAYDSTYDLSQLVMVCDHKGHTYDAATYGLEFQFNLVDYWCYHDGSDYSSAVNQSGYFGLQEDGSTLYVLPNVTDGDVASRLAIGKYAPIRVTLVDTNNVDSSGNPAVVDVRYFFIECKDASAFYDMGDLLNDTTDWTGCGDEYTITVLEDSIKAKCGQVDEKTGVDMPITYEELIGNYKLLTSLWATLEDAKTVGTTDEDGNSTESSPDDDLGTIALSDGNIVWTVTPEITQEDYDLGQKVIEAWGVYQSTTLDSNIIPFKLTLTITLPKMTRIANHNEPYWVVTSGTNTHSGNDTDSVRIFNPALETDATYGDSKYQTTQMIGDLLVGYIMNGTIPHTWKSTISSCDNAHVAFDDTYLEALREAINETYGFKEGDTDYIGEDDLAITNSGHTLTLKGVPVAEYVADANSGSLHYIRLIETDDGSDTSVPAGGAELLVGQYIPLMYYGTTCSWNEVMDQWFVYFMEPLTMEKGKVINIDLYDVTAGGSTSGDQLDGTIELWEEFTTNKRLVWDNAEPTKVTDTNLAAWYGVNDPEYDVDNAVTNLTLSGGVGTTFDNKLSAFKKDDGTTNMYNLIYDKANNQFVFNNNSDSSIGTAFEVIVPVILQTKWQTFTAMQVHITIHPSW